MKNKKVFIPIVILVVLVVAFLVYGRYNLPVCGDGVCQKDELQGAKYACENDCHQDCVIPTGATDNEIQQTCSIGWSSTYSLGLSSSDIQQDWMQPSQIIDYGNPKIQELAKSLKRATPKDTARAIAQWTYANIRYDYTDGYFDCRDWSASQILDRQSGVCSTMTKLNIALLRANGIPAYSETGCYKFNEACKLQQTFFGNPFPKFINITIEKSGYAPTLGYLHNWVVVPIYQDGKWEYPILESTSGVLYEDSCINYKVYYKDPADNLACGLSGLDPNLRDCQQW